MTIHDDEEVYLTKQVLVTVAGLAPQYFPPRVQFQMAAVLGFEARYTNFGNKSVDGCSWSLFGAGRTFIHKF